MDLLGMKKAMNHADQEVSKIPTPYKIKPSVATIADLPLTGNEAGDVRVVDDINQFRYYWDGTAWHRFLAYNIRDYVVTYEDGTSTTIHNVESGV